MSSKHSSRISTFNIALSLLSRCFAIDFLIFCMGALVSWFRGKKTGDKGRGHIKC